MKILKRWLKSQTRYVNNIYYNEYYLSSLIYVHVQYTRTESDGLGYATVRLTGSPIAKVLEKNTIRCLQRV